MFSATTLRLQESGRTAGVVGAIAAAERRKDFRMRRQDVAESAGQARTACPARSVRNPDEAKGPAQRAGELARGAGAGPAPTGPARSPAAGEMKLPGYRANETCSEPACQTEPALSRFVQRTRSRLRSRSGRVRYRPARRPSTIIFATSCRRPCPSSSV